MKLFEGEKYKCICSIKEKSYDVLPGQPTKDSIKYAVGDIVIVGDVFYERLRDSEPSYIEILEGNTKSLSLDLFVTCFERATK